MKLIKHVSFKNKSTHRLFCTSTTATGKTDYFGYEGQSEFYRLYRPQYPLQMLQNLHERIPIQKSNRTLAVDIACGSGQLTYTLSKPLNISVKTRDEFGFGFNKVIGLDTSVSQLEKALEYANNSNIEYKLENIGNYLSIHDNSVDLVTIAQGLHWFDIPKLLTDVKRVIKHDNGLFAVLGYGTPRFEQYEKFQEAFADFYVNILGSYNYGINHKHCYWNIDRQLLDFGFKDTNVFFENELFDEKTFERNWIFENIFMNEEQLFGYFQSMSGYRTYLKEHGLEYGDNGDPMNYLHDVYKQDMEKYKQNKIMVIFPFFLLTMKK